MTPFDTSQVRFGVNYTPSRHWYYCWNDWDARSIQADFRALAALGIDHLRVQLIWPYFQPNPAYVSEAHLRRLSELVQLAADQGLDVLLSLLTGFLSGYAFLPSNVSPRAVFTDPDVLESEVLFAHRVLETVGDRANFMGLDLGNEINCLDQGLDAAIGDRWAAQFLDRVRPRISGRLIVNGVDNYPWMVGSTFTPRHLASDAYDMATMHCWPEFSGCLAGGRRLDEAPSLYLSRFYCEWVSLFSPRPRPRWIQEFGCCDLWGTPEEQDRYLRRGVELALEAGAAWFTFWCSHDKTRDVKFDPFEYHYGLLSTENREKRLAGVYRELAQAHRGRPAARAEPRSDVVLTVPAGFCPTTDPALPLEAWRERTLRSDFWRYYGRYLEVIAGGGVPTLKQA
ncbi:MAG: cellulase family glycosylhydrolase [Thermoguttaceae bacterium]|jgi:endo-1,4-beta-mannosidase